MIQELLGGAGLIGEERKSSLNGGVLEGSASSSPSPSSSSTTTTNTTTTSSDHQNLKCPRCDSSNTKFCYYNNYNLTQPRHFCKTCRRYWTKGGALRSVPIGGGSRKIKNTGKSSSGKVKLVSTDIIKSNPISRFNHELPSNPFLWASPQNSQLLALLRATQNPNPNSMSNSVIIKDEGAMIGSHMTLESAVATGALNERTMSLDPLSQVPIGLCSSFWRNYQQHQQNFHLHQPQHSFLLGEVQNTGIQELYRRLKSSANCYTDHSPAVMSSLSSTSSPSLSTMEPAPIAGSELGYWNPALSWPDLSTTNCAYP